MKILDKLTGKNKEDPKPEMDYGNLTGHVKPIEHPAGLWYCGAEVDVGGEKHYLPQGLNTANVGDGGKVQKSLQPFYFLTEASCKLQCKVYNKLIKWAKDTQATPPVSSESQ
jgi:hypothetical protein